MTITPSLGNQTGQAVELPGYDTSTNASGILTSQVFGILNDKYTKEEIDNINSAINTAISKKQDKLTAGANIRIVDNVISAFNNHLFLHLDENDTEHQAYVYSFIKSNLEFYLFAEITYEGKVVVLPLVAIENNESLDLKGIYLKDDSTIVEVSAILVANGNISVNTSEINLNEGSSDYNNLTNKPQINSVELSGNKTLADLGIQAAGDYATNNQVTESINNLKTSLESQIELKQDKGNYALKSDIPTKVSELQNDSQFVTGTALTDGLAPKADKTYVDEQLATKQPVGDYATTSDLALKADKSTVNTLQEQVTSNTSAIATKQDKLVSGTNIKTINGQTLLGSGDIEVGGGGTSDYTQLTNKPQINSVELTGNKSLSDIGAQPAGNYALKSEIPDVSGLATKEEVTTGLSGKQDTLVSGTNIKTINSQSLVGSGNIDITADSIPTLFMTNSTTPDSETFDNVYSAIQNNQPYAIYYYSYPASMLYDTATISGENILAIFHNEYNTVHTSVFVTIKKGAQPEVRTDQNNYVKYGTGTQPQINTITVLTQSEYDGLSTKDPNTQYLIVE